MNVKNIVQTLLSLSSNPDGTLDSVRVGAVCAYVSKTFAPTAALKILRVYKRKAELAISADTAQIASAGVLDNESQKVLEAFVKSKNKNARIEFTKDENLIAGVKVSVGDNVWENSVRMKLENLRQSLGA